MFGGERELAIALEVFFDLGILTARLSGRVSPVVGGKGCDPPSILAGDACAPEHVCA